MGISLLTTKFYIPPRRPNSISRPRLMNRLERALRLHHRLTLVSAKAGSGKTTLVSDWIQQQKQPAAWLSLDENDNDPRRFLNYLVAALRRLDIEVCPAVLGQLEMSQRPQPEALVTTLINDLVASARPFLLVLDDYHSIHDEWIHQVVKFLTDHQPPEMHLILVTRIDPPFPLARLRARGRMTEIRDRDLQFTAEEAAWFFKEAMGLDLPDEAVSMIERRTEGWIVGLQMASLAIQARLSMSERGQDVDLIAFVEAFGGSNRFILDYLMEEVIEQQPSAIQDFMIESAILERMCGALCDAVRFEELESSQVVAAQDSQAILAYLERSNLFVSPLDDERKWYRYHHLFADLLDRTLHQRRSKEEIRKLHRRASRWHQDAGSLEEALRHAMMAQDYERAATMIDENIARVLSRSEAPVLLGWIEKLPEQIVEKRPWIDIHRVYTLALSGQLERVDPMLEVLESRINSDTPRASELLGHITAIRAYAANLRGDVARAIEMAKLTEKYLPDKHLNARGMAAYALAETCFASDDMNGASAAAHKMLRVGEQTGQLLMVIPALCDLAAIKKVQGQLHQAKGFYDRAWQWLVKQGGQRARMRCPYEIGLADLLREWNQLDAAHEHAVTGIAHCKRFGVYGLQVSGHLTSMRILQARGNMENALDILRNAEEMMQAYDHRLALRIEFHALRVVQWLAVGDVERASRCADELNGRSELEQMALSRLRLAQGRVDDARRLIERQRSLAEADGRTGRLIEILGLQALVLEAQGQADEADIVLTQALSLARPEGYVRVFLDLGGALCEILKRLAKQNTLANSYGAGMVHILQSYVRDLLDAFQQERIARQRAMKEISSSPLAASRLIDPLTARELQVLRLLAKGLSNKKIAGKLIVAPSTIKQHLKNIYGKLNVHSRTQAVARGRELDLL